MKFLALYTGPGGPISREFAADDLDLALEAVGRDGRQWYHDACNALDVDPDSPTLEDDITGALETGHWVLECPARHTGEYALYTRVGVA